MYFIVGIDVAKGTYEDDVSSSRPYYELGWEVVTTHFDVKHMKRAGELAADSDTVVTCSGREFLYRADFANVIDYSEYRAKHAFQPSLSLMERYSEGIIPNDYYEGGRHSAEAKYKYKEVDRDIIQSIETVPTEKLHNDEPFCVFLVRKRRHGSYRNMIDEVAIPVLNRLSLNYGHVFIVGHGSKHLERLGSVIHVDLQTYASLIRSPMCELVIGSMTGTMQMAAVLSRAKRCVVVLNYDGYDIDGTNHPVNLGPCIRLSQSRFDLVDPSHFLKFVEREPL